MSNGTRLLAGIGIGAACLGLCAAAPGEERGTGFLYAGKWPAPPAEKGAPPYDWRSWSGPRSSYWTPVDDRPDNEYERARIRVDRRLHLPDARATSGRIGFTLWSYHLAGTWRIHQGPTFGALFVSPSPAWPNNDSRRYGYISVPADFYGALDFSPVLLGGTDGADAPAAYVVNATATAGIRTDDELKSLRAFVTDRPDPQYSLLACVDPTRENVAAAVEGLERALALARGTASSKAALLNLGWFHHRLTRDRGKALWCFERVYQDLASVPGLQGAAAYYYGLTLEDAGRPGEAKQVYEKLLRTYPEDFWTTDAIERLERLGVPQSSLRLGLSSAGEAATRRYLRAFAGGDYGAALKQARAVSAANPYDPWSRLYETYLLRLKPDEARADRSLTALQRDWPPYAEAVGLLCDVFAGFDQQAKELPLAARLRPHALRAITEPLPFLLARVRDRKERFPEDPLAWILRAQSRCLMEVPQIDARPIGLDAVSEYRHAVELAPRSWAVRMYGFGLDELYNPPRGRQLTSAEVADNLEALLRLNEKDTWGLHAPLAEVLKAPELLNRPKEGEDHQRRYEALKKRYGAPRK